MEKAYLEQRIVELEKKLAELKKVQEQPIDVTVKLTNIDDLEKLINEINEKLNELKNFKIKASIIWLFPKLFKSIF